MFLVITPLCPCIDWTVHYYAVKFSLLLFKAIRKVKLLMYIE